MTGPDALVAYLGEDHLDRDAIPWRLRCWVDDALLHGLVFEDCREQIAAL